MNQTLATRRRSVSHIFTGALIISFSSVWVALSQVDPSVSAFYRVFFGSFFLFIGCLMTKSLRPVSAKALLYSVVCGFFFAGDLYCWHLSIAYVGPGLATILGNFQVFVLTLISQLFFGQRLRLTFLLSLLLAFLGLFLVIGIDWQTLSADYRIGVFFGLVTAVFYAFFILALRRIQELEEGISFVYALLLVSIATSFILGPLVWFSGNSFTIPSSQSLLALISLALFSQAIGWAFISRSLPHLIPSLAGLVLLAQPAFSFIWDVLLFQRPTSLVQWCGVIIVLAAIYLGANSTRRAV